jgi:hypothetical protein
LTDSKVSRIETATANTVAKWTPVRIKNPKDVFRDGRSPGSQFTYSAASPGVLEIAMEAEMVASMPAHLLQYLREHLQWDVQAIDDSHDPQSGGKFVELSMDPNWLTNSGIAEDAFSGRGGIGEPVRARFTGLPRNNSDFGNKLVSLSLRSDLGGVPPIDQITCQVFFPKFANNHNPPDPAEPNWYHYYGQEASPVAPIQYAGPYNSIAYSECSSWEDACWRLYPTPNGDPFLTDILVFEAAQDLDLRTFVSLVVHENKHDAFFRNEI